MLPSFGKNVLVFIPEYALKEVHNSQMIGISQINASTAINKLCNTIEEVLLLLQDPEADHLRMHIHLHQPLRLSE